MLYREALVNELLQRIDADPQVHVHKIGVDLLVTLGGLHAFGHHRLI